MLRIRPLNFITLETKYLMYYGSNKIKVSSVGKIRANLPTTYPVLMKAIKLRETISPQSEGEIRFEVKRQITLDRFKPALIVLFEREEVFKRNFQTRYGPVARKLKGLPQR